MSFARKRKRVRFAPVGASLTEQHFRDRQDVNSIVERCLRGDTSGLRACGVNADISYVATDLQTMLNNRIEADMAFDSLPTAVKEKFKTPSDFLAACSDESNRQLFDELGLLVKVAEVKPVEVKVVNPVTSEGGVV